MKDEINKLMSLDSMEMPADFIDRLEFLEGFLSEYVNVGRIIGTCSVDKYISSVCKDNNIKVGSKMYGLIKTKMRGYTAIDLYSRKCDGEIFIHPNSIGMMGDDLTSFDVIRLYGVKETIVLNSPQTKKRGPVEDAMYSYLISNKLFNTKALHFFKHTYLRHSSCCKIKYWYDKIFKREGVCAVYTLLSLLLRNEVGIFENWFDYHLSERKINQGKRQKHILEIKEKNGVSYVSDFSFAPIDGGYCYVGVVKIGSFKNTLKKTVEILDVMGAEREFYTSDVQDTYVFIRNGEVFSIPYDLRMSKDLIEVKNRINISNGYQNEFSQISI